VDSTLAFFHYLSVEDIQWVSGSTVHLLAWLHSSLIPQLLAWIAWPAIKHYKIFLVWVKCCFVETKSCYLFYKRCWKWCPCMCTYTVYHLSWLKFIVLAVDKLELLVSCARHVSDFCGVHFDLAIVSCSFCLVSKQLFFFVAGFLSRSGLADLALWISSWCLLCMEMCSWKNYDKIFTDTF
jgi:hypothetical protein